MTNRTRTGACIHPSFGAAIQNFTDRAGNITHAAIVTLADKQALAGYGRWIHISSATPELM